MFKSIQILACIQRRKMSFQMRAKNSNLRKNVLKLLNIAEILPELFLPSQTFHCFQIVFLLYALQPIWRLTLRSKTVKPLVGLCPCDTIFIKLEHRSNVFLVTRNILADIVYFPISQILTQRKRVASSRAL